MPQLTSGISGETNIDYGNETVKYISFQTATGWMDIFQGYIDAITIALINGTTVTIDLEGFASEVWVDDDWADLPPGYEVEPGKFIGYNAFAKIQDGVNAIAEGGTVHVYEGTYSGAIIDKNVKLYAAPGETPIITSGVPYKSGATLYTAFRLDNSADGTEIKGFLIKCNSSDGFYFAVFSRGVDDIIVDSLTVNDAVQGITNWGGSNWEIKNNVLNNTEAAGGGGIAIWLGARPPNYPVCSGNVIYNNIITASATASDYTCPGIGLGLDLRYGGYDQLTGSEDISGNKIINNTVTAPGALNGVGIEMGVLGLEGNETKIAATLGLVHDNVIQGNIVDGADLGIYVYTVTNIQVYGNEIRNCNEGIHIKDGLSNIAIHYNNIFGNNFGINNTVTEPVDARYNWWGDASGPYHSTLNPDGAGNAVSDNVDFAPWLSEPYPPAILYADVFIDINKNGLYDSEEPAFYSIQDAIDAASPGDTVIVNMGTYREALYIDKNLTLKGIGLPTIEAPDNIPLREFTGPSGPQRTRPIIFVYGKIYVTIDGFIIDGRGIGNTNYGFAGIQYFSASGTIKNNIIKAIRDTPLSGAQHGCAIIVNHLWDQYQEHTVYIINNTIFDYQKNGITCNEPGTVAYVINNIVTGYGLTGTIAQNGIQFGWNATGIIEGNIVSGHKYNDTTAWWSCGILLYLYSNGTIVRYSTVTDNNAGVYVYASNNVTIQFNNIYGNTEYGVYNEPSAVIDARYNWWGNATGPYHPTLNPTGTGDAVSDDVNFDHWLLEGYPPPLPSPVIYIDPAEVEYWTLAYGETFQVGVKIEEVTNLAGYEFKLYWDTSLLDLVNIEITPPWPEGNYIIAKNYTDESSGLYWLGVGSYMTPPFSGSTTLATLTFQITYDPVYPENATCTLDLKDTKLSAPAGEPIYHIAYDGKYSIYSTKPKIEVKPSTYTAHAYEEIFTVDIYVSDIVDLYNYTFKLSYDTTLLDAVNLEIGTFLNPPLYVYKFIIDDANGEIWLWVWSTSGTPVSGSGVLATLTFEVTKATTWTKYHPNILECTLDLHDTLLVTDKGIEVPHDVEDGLYRYEPKPGDLDCNGHVGLTDLRIVAYYYDPAYNQAADLNEDGVVDIYDLQIVAYYYGENC